MNVFDSVISPLIFSYRCVFALFLSNATYGLLKPQVSGIKIVIVYRRSIFQVESHKDSTTSRPLKNVKPCSAGFAPGWVTKYE